MNVIGLAIMGAVLSQLSSGPAGDEQQHGRRGRLVEGWVTNVGLPSSS